LFAYYIIEKEPKQAFSMETILFTIKQPHASVEHREVRSVTLPTKTGVMQILPGHADMVAETEPGACTIEREKGRETIELPSAGILRVHRGSAVLIL